MAHFLNLNPPEAFVFAETFGGINSRNLNPQRHSKSANLNPVLQVCGLRVG
jgi:hypothetical protein